MTAEIMCRLCGSKIGTQGFSRHLSSFHKVDYFHYMKDNIEDFKDVGWDLCSYCKKEPARKTRKDLKWACCSKECNKKMRSRLMIGKPSRALGSKWTNEQKKRHSEIKKKTAKKGKNNPACDPKIRKKISESMKKHVNSEGYVNPMKGKKHSPEALKKIFKRRKYTNPEKIIAEYLDSRKIEYYYQFFLSRNKKIYSYDFKIKGSNILIEVDGDYWHGGPGVEKHFFKSNKIQKNDRDKDLLAKENDYTIIRLWESEIEKSFDECQSKLEKYL